MSKYYKIAKERITDALSYEYRSPKKYTPFHGDTLESHEYYEYSQGEVYNKVKTLVLSKTHAFKVNIQLGYKLIDRNNGLERDYWPSSNTVIWDNPIAINSKRDIDAKIMSYIHAKDFTISISDKRISQSKRILNSFRNDGATIAEYSLTFVKQVRPWTQLFRYITAEKTF